MDKLVNKLSELSGKCYKLEWLGLLAIRMYLFQSFFKIGFAYISEWNVTLISFGELYELRSLSPEIAAMLFTGCALGIPSLLLLGVFGRVPAIVLFVFNIVMLLSSKTMWLEAPEALCMLHKHYILGLLCFISIIFGAGAASVDKMIQSRFTNYRF